MYPLCRLFQFLNEDSAASCTKLLLLLGTSQVVSLSPDRYYAKCSPAQSFDREKLKAVQLAAIAITMTSLTVRKLMRVGRKILSTSNPSMKPAFIFVRHFSSEKEEIDSIHFRATNTPHPLASEGNTMKANKATLTVITKDEHGHIKTEVTISVVNRITKDLGNNFLISRGID